MQGRIGKYEVAAEIGRGALVKVFRASDRDTERTVTLKLLTPEGRHLADVFRRKVATAARLRHPHFIAIYELGEHEGLPFAAMQHLGERSLSQMLGATSALPLVRKLAILCQAAEGLRAAHEGGLGAVELRPSGIALGEDGAAVIQDFSVVRAMGAGEPDAAAYIAPEQNAGGEPDALCDIYAFGAICCEFLAGAETLPDTLERLVQRALEAGRERRYRSMGELLDDAEPVLRRLKRARAAQLLVDARRLQHAEDLEPAQAALREVLELDPGNRQADRVQETVRAELQRRQLQARLDALLEEAELAAAVRRFEYAIEVLESARRLDPENAQAGRRLEEMRASLERSREGLRLAQAARRLLEEERLEEALVQATAARERDPGLPEAAEVMQAVTEAIRRRDEEARITRLLAQANALMEEQSFEAAIAIVQELRAQSRNSALLDLWLQRAQSRKAEAERQKCLEAELAAIRALIAQENLQKAVIRLALLREEFADDATVAALQEEATAAMERADRLRQALAEAQWLLDQDHPDLAAEFLREKCRELPGEPRLAGRLQAVEEMLPDWENYRFVRDCLGRAQALEEMQQWAAALALVEQALEKSPAAEALLQTAARLRGRQREEDLQKKLARRLEAIAGKLAAGACEQALALIDGARAEFPGEAELERLAAEAREGMRRAECDSLAGSVRQCLADGDAGRAEQMLAGAHVPPGAEALLEQLRREVEESRQLDEAWRTAQALFGRRQYREAEELLLVLAARNRPGAQALLETVRGARAASEENDFFKRGHEQALKLIEQRQFAQAADLVRNLLNLFPDNAILERDLRAAEAGLRAVQPTPPEPKAEPAPEPARAQPAPRLEMSVPAAGPSRLLWAAIAALLLVSASAAVWKLSGGGKPAAVEARAASAVERPKVLDAPQPRLPRAALQRGLRGVVKLEATVGEEGAVKEVRVLSGEPILAAAAKEAVRAWRFQPGAIGGRPAQMNVNVEVQF